MPLDMQLCCHYLKCPSQRLTLCVTSAMQALVARVRSAVVAAVSEPAAPSDSGTQLLPMTDVYRILHRDCVHTEPLPLLSLLMDELMVEPTVNHIYNFVEVGRSMMARMCMGRRLIRVLCLRLPMQPLRIVLPTAELTMQHLGRRALQQYGRRYLGLLSKQA